MSAAARLQTPPEVTRAVLKRGGRRTLHATITVHRGPAHTGETLEVDVEGVIVAAKPTVGLQRDIEDFRATYHGADFTLTQQETERAMALLLGN